MEITCGIFLQRKDKKVLFIHPTLSPEGFISIPKGIYEDKDENYFNAAKRELLEETGVDLDQYEGQAIEVEGFFQYHTRNKALKAFIYKTDHQIDQELQCQSYFVDNDQQYIEADAFYWIDPTTIHKQSDIPYSPHHTQQMVIDRFFPPDGM